MCSIWGEVCYIRLYSGLRITQCKYLSEQRVWLFCQNVLYWKKTVSNIRLKNKVMNLGYWFESSDWRTVVLICTDHTVIRSTETRFKDTFSSYAGKKEIFAENLIHDKKWYDCRNANSIRPRANHKKLRGMFNYSNPYFFTACKILKDTLTSYCEDVTKKLSTLSTDE